MTETHEKRTETHACDLISRTAALDALGEEPLVWHEDDAGEVAERNQWRRDVAAIKALPSAQQWIPCSERRAEFPCLACDTFGQIFVTNCGVVTINEKCYDAEKFSFDVEQFLKGEEIDFGDGTKGYILPRQIVAWQRLPEPWKGER